jgi:uncharacterized repeat protein (TIGR03803 family)
MPSKKLSAGLNLVLAIVTVTPFVTGTLAAAQQERVLHNFNVTGTDGNHPWGGLIFDAAGNLYGTTSEGGTGQHGTGVCSKISPYSCGTVFELSHTASGWTEKILHNFHGTDGWLPTGSLIMDAAGNLYGTTQQGGTGLCTPIGSKNLIGCGTIFELSPAAGGNWTETVLHNFNNDGSDGVNPYAGLTSDSAGNLYGTTFVGGAYSYGTVFELSRGVGGVWSETVLHSFNFLASDGASPFAGVILDSAGNIYGTTQGGGAFSGGTAFELKPAVGGGWTETILHNFIFSFSIFDGYTPDGGLTFDAAGNLYGTTVSGVSNGSMTAGTVFKLSPATGGSWTETILYNFIGPKGFQPQSDLIFDAAGNLYGTAHFGGTGNASGTVFELTPQAGGGWAVKLLYDFGKSNGSGGSNPVAGLIFDAAGNLYGTTLTGGSGPCPADGPKGGCGTVFQLKP